MYFPMNNEQNSECFDVFLSHNHVDRKRVERIATLLKERHKQRVWLDCWEMPNEPIQRALERGVEASRFVVLCCTKAALKSKWVQLERQMAFAKDPLGRNQIPLLFEDVNLPLGIKMLPCHDFRNSANDAVSVNEVAAIVNGTSVHSVIDAGSRPTRYAIVYTGTVTAELRQNVEAVMEHLRHLTSDQTLTLRAIEESSVRLILDGSEQSEVLIRKAFEDGRLNSVLGVDVQGVFSVPSPPPHGFVGRIKERNKLRETVSSSRALILSGMGGMGKTTLACQFARECYPGATCFINLEYGASEEWIAFMLGAFFEGVDFARHRQETQFERAEALFQDRPILVVCDNFETVIPEFMRDKGNQDRRIRIIELLNRWTSADGRGRLLITTRVGNVGLKEAVECTISGLDRDDSIALLERLYSDSKNKLQKFPDCEELDRLAATLADHPLSLVLIGRHLADTPVDEIVARLDTLSVESTKLAEVSRNSSLLASLRFSTDRLSEAASAALAWLGMFDVGVFEAILLGVSQIPDDDWNAIQVELQATALLQVQDDIRLGDRPYLRLHPTLPPFVRATNHGAEKGSEGPPKQTSADDSTFVTDDPESRRRFVAAYAALALTIENVGFRGSHGKQAMEVLALEEPNFRRAVRWAIDDGEFSTAAAMGNAFKIYLQSANRLPERDAWVQWLANEAGQTDWSATVAAAERNAAWSLLTQGRAEEAFRRLQTLIKRLEQTTEFDPEFELAVTKLMLGRMHHATGRATAAISVLRDAVSSWQTLVVRQASKLSTAKGETASRSINDVLGDNQLRTDCAAQLGNLSLALGDLANALRSAGQLDEALNHAEESLAIQIALNNERDRATTTGQMGQILMDQGRYAEADGKYQEALAAARATGDSKLEASILQGLGLLARQRGDHNQAIQRYREAMSLFQMAGDDGAVMRTANLLGVAELKQGRLSEARQWYERSHEIAVELRDPAASAATAANLGFVYQQEGEAAREQSDMSLAEQYLATAERLFLESLQTEEDLHNEAGQTRSHARLGQLYLTMNRLDEGMRHAERARELGERLNDHRLLSSVYSLLKSIAVAHDDTAMAESMSEKVRALNEELAVRARGGNQSVTEQQIEELLTNLTVASVQAALGDKLPREADEVLKQMDSPDAGPLQPLATWLRRIATASEEELRSLLDLPPPDLPQGVQGVLEQIRKQLW